MTAAPPAIATSKPLSSADFGTRFSAFVIDALLLFSGQWIMFIVLSRQLQVAGMTATEPCEPGGVAQCEGPNTALWALLLVLYVATTLGYYALFEGRYGATPGKRWMGLRVTNSQGQSPIGMAAGWLRSVMRQLFWLTPLFLFDVSPLSLGLPAPLFVLVPALALIVFVLGAFRPDGLAGHDLLAKTVVVRNDANSASSGTPTICSVAPTTVPTLPTTAAPSGSAQTDQTIAGLPPIATARDDDLATDDREESA